MVREEHALGLLGAVDAGVHALEGEGAGEVGAAGEEEAGGEELLEGGGDGLHGALGVLRARRVSWLQGCRRGAGVRGESVGCRGAEEEQAATCSGERPATWVLRLCVRGEREKIRANLLGGEAGDVGVEGAGDDEERAALLEEAEAGEDPQRGAVDDLRARREMGMHARCTVAIFAGPNLQRDVVVVLADAEAAALALDAGLGERDALQEADGLRAR